MSNENAPHDEQNRPAVGVPVERMVRPVSEAPRAVLDTDDIEVLREALAAAWGDLMVAQLKCNDQAAEIELLCATLARTRERAALDFAKFLHSLPAEDGWDVGPARVKYSARGALEGGPLWATLEDTERWARAFLQGPNE